MSVENSPLHEELAAYAHEAWSGWMRYLFSKCESKFRDGSLEIPPWAVERWMRQMNTDYKDLPLEEQLLDQAEAAKIMALIEGWMMREEIVKKLST